MNLENGTIMCHNKILEEIGKGCMGEVYLAQDTEHHGEPAIKFLAEELSGFPTSWHFSNWDDRKRLLMKKRRTF